MPTANCEHSSASSCRGAVTVCPLDLMRRDPTADNGLVELMVASLAERAAVFGVGRVSLNFAMFREAFERGA